MDKYLCQGFEEGLELNSVHGDSQGTAAVEEDGIQLGPGTSWSRTTPAVLAQNDQDFGVREDQSRIRSEWNGASRQAVDAVEEDAEEQVESVPSEKNADLKGGNGRDLQQECNISTISNSHLSGKLHFSM